MLGNLRFGRSHTRTEQVIDRIADGIETDPYLTTLREAEITAARPLTPCEMVTDDLLRRLAAGDPAFDRGEVPADMQAELAMLLPDIAGELLAHRAGAAARGGRA